MLHCVVCVSYSDTVLLSSMAVLHAVLEGRKISLSLEKKWAATSVSLPFYMEEPWSV